MNKAYFANLQLELLYLTNRFVPSSSNIHLYQANHSKELPVPLYLVFVWMLILLNLLTEPGS